jgi:hypothetical protein
MRSLTLFSILIAGLSACAPIHPDSELCSLDHVTTSKDDHLTRETKEQIAVLNKTLRDVCSQ